MTKEQFLSLTTPKRLALDRRYKRASKRHFKGRETVPGLEHQQFMEDWLAKQPFPK